MKGFIYVMTNPSFDFLKIGRTKSDPSVRAGALSQSTSTPFPFHLFWYAYVEDYEKAEKLIHDHFREVRVNPKREFFEVPAFDIISLIKRDLDIEILFENVNPQSLNWTAEYAPKVDKSERWRHFKAPGQYPFKSCAHCKQPALGTIYSLDDENEASDSDRLIAIELGSLVSPYCNLLLGTHSEDWGMPTKLVWDGAYYCWHCGVEKHESSDN